MEFVLIILIPIIFILAITIPFKNSYKGRRLKVFFVITGVPFIVLFGDELIGQAILKTTCIINGGYKTAEIDKTQGYFVIDRYGNNKCDSQCVKALVITGIPYYENTFIYDHSKYPNIYSRYYLADLSSVDGYQCVTLGKFTYDKFKPFLKNRCVIYKEIEKPSSKYEISLTKTIHLVKQPFEMQKSYSYVKDRDTSKIIASATSYRYWGGWVRNTSFGHNPASSCPSFDESHGGLLKNLFSI